MFLQMRRLVVVIIAMALLAFGCTREPVSEVLLPDSPAQTFKVPAGSIPGIIRVKFKQEPGLTKSSLPELPALGNYSMTRTFPPAGKWEERHRRAGLHLWYDIIFDESIPLTRAGAEVSALPEISIMSFVPEIRPSDLEYPFYDPKLKSQWHYQNPGGKAQWAEGCV